MDTDTRRAFDNLWRNGIDPVNKRIDRFEESVNEKFSEIRKTQRFLVAQFIALVGILVVLVGIFMKR